MLKRFDRLNISLAAKCQLLFGTAVTLIIAAALLVPWQRMEQLMWQINERSADTLAEWAVSEHVAGQLRLPQTRPAPVHTPSALPASRPAAIQSPATQPADGKPRVRLIMLHNPPADATRFELRALDYFKQNPNAAPLARAQRSRTGQGYFRYARPLYLEPRCVACHAAPAAGRPATTTPPAGRNSLANTRPSATQRAHRGAPLTGFVSVDIPQQVDTNQAFVNRLFMFLAGLLAGTLAIIAFYLITTRLILQPVRVLRETAEKVSRGDLNIRSHISTGDEFQQLSETFNRMLANLEESANQLRAINRSLDLKIGQLSETNLALYESNRLKSEFLANVSHELRTPLNSILGFAELLQESLPASDARLRRYLQNIMTSGRHLLALITDLLDLAKIEAGRMDVHCEPLSLTDLLEGLANVMRPLSEPKSVSLAVDVAADVPIIQTDHAKLQQVLYNLLSNAIKFSPEGGKVDVRAERLNGEHVRISVVDRGPGIPPDKHALIFEKFTQLDGSVTRSHGGTGLGLAISRELTTLLGGRIGLDSEPGRGATFWIVLPVRLETSEA